MGYNPRIFFLVGRKERLIGTGIPKSRSFSVGIYGLFMVSYRLYPLVYVELWDGELFPEQNNGTKTENRQPETENRELKQRIRKLKV
jgi:hypothetical protein